MPKNLPQISVPLPPELLAFVQAEAKAEDRSPAGQIRHYVAEAQRRKAVSGDRAVPPPDFGNPAMPTVTPASLATNKAQLAAWKAERKRLEARDCPGGQQHIYLTTAEAQRLNWLHTAVDYVEREVRRVEGTRSAIVNEHELAIQAGRSKLIHG
jgi:hypothetical protein